MPAKPRAIRAEITQLPEANITMTQQGDQEPHFDGIVSKHTFRRPQEHDPERIPAWLRPFFSLRWRLTFVYVAVFGIVLLLVGTLISYTAVHASLSSLLWIITIVSIVAIVIGALVTSLATGIMLQPLKEMTETVRAIARGDFRQRVHLPGGEDEVGRLARSFNEMIDQIERAFEAQRSSERRAHRLISNASHELRTPLTSIRGLTEVLLRNERDDPYLLQRVLKLMKSESERMTRLVNDLLTLARLD